MADQEKWELSREEIEARLKELGQKKLEKTRGGRSSGQGVKLLYIRDYLYHHNTVEVVEEALDVNGDGAVNNKDLTRLFQYLSDYDVELHEPQRGAAQPHPVSLSKNPTRIQFHSVSRGVRTHHQ